MPALPEFPSFMSWKLNLAQTVAMVWVQVMIPLTATKAGSSRLNPVVFEKILPFGMHYSGVVIKSRLSFWYELTEKVEIFSCREEEKEFSHWCVEKRQAAGTVHSVSISSFWNVITVHWQGKLPPNPPNNRKRRRGDLSLDEGRPALNNIFEDHPNGSKVEIVMDKKVDNTWQMLADIVQAAPCELLTLNLSFSC